MARRRRQSLTGIDIGTAAVKMVMGEATEGENIAILGFCELSSAGKVVKGEVINANALSEIVSESLDRLEKKAQRRVESTFVSITGPHLGSRNVMGNVPIDGPDQVISEQDVILATRQALAFNFPPEQVAVHSFQRSFVVDEGRRVSQPVGMVGSRLVADVHYIYGNRNRIQTTLAAVAEALGERADDMAFSGIADFFGLAPTAEQRQGVLIVDLGAGVTEYVVFFADGCMHSGQLAVGCEHVANDLSIGLSLPIGRCRELLRRHGSAVRKANALTQKIEVETSIGRPPRIFRQAAIQTVIEMRLQEVFGIIRRELEANDVLNMIGNRVYLVGGGAMIPAVCDLAEQVFGVPASIGYPARISGVVGELNSPRWVTAVGLLHLGRQLKEMDSPQLNGMRDVMRVIRDDWHKLLDFCRGTIRF